MWELIGFAGPTRKLVRSPKTIRPHKAKNLKVLTSYAEHDVA